MKITKLKWVSLLVSLYEAKSDNMRNIMTTKFWKTHTIAWTMILFLHPAYSQDEASIETQNFSNKYFSLELPADWSVDESRKGTFLIPRDNDKGLHVTIFNVKDPNKSDSLRSSSKKKDGYQILRNEYEFHSGVGYKIFDGYKPKDAGHSGFRLVELILQNNNHLVYLSFGDYACLTKSCSNDLINIIESSFVVYDSEYVSLGFQELIERFIFMKSKRNQ